MEKSTPQGSLSPKDADRFYVRSGKGRSFVHRELVTAVFDVLSFERRSQGLHGEGLQGREDRRRSGPPRFDIRDPACRWALVSVDPTAIPARLVVWVKRKIATIWSGDWDARLIRRALAVAKRERQVMEADRQAEVDQVVLASRRQSLARAEVAVGSVPAGVDLPSLPLLRRLLARCAEADGEAEQGVVPADEVLLVDAVRRDVEEELVAWHRDDLEREAREERERDELEAAEVAEAAGGLAAEAEGVLRLAEEVSRRSPGSDGAFARAAQAVRLQRMCVARTRSELALRRRDVERLRALVDDASRSAVPLVILEERATRGLQEHATAAPVRREAGGGAPAAPPQRGSPEWHAQIEAARRRAEQLVQELARRGGS